MSEFGQNLKNAVMKGIEAIGNTATSLASNTRQKMEEYNLSNQLKDIYSEIGAQVYELSKQGIVFPSELSGKLQLAAETEETLNGLRTQSNETASDDSPEEKDSGECRSEEENSCGSPEATDYAAENNCDIPVIRVEREEEKTEDTGISDNSPLSSAINDLFDNIPSVDKIADKVNSSLDELDESLRKFSGSFDKQLNEFADKMMGNSNKDQ